VKTLLLGLGNELYGDDGIGIQVVRRLKEEAAQKTRTAAALRDTDLEECCLSGLALLDVIVGYDRLVIVDTIKRLSPVPGRIHLLDEKDVRSLPGPSPHYVSIPQAIEIGRQLGLHVPSEIRIVAVEAKNMYSLGESLSREMQERLPAIVRRVKSVLRES
jgi:hydrogenase maturation protease